MAETERQTERNWNRQKDKQKERVSKEGSDDRKDIIIHYLHIFLVEAKIFQNQNFKNIHSCHIKQKKLQGEQM